MKKKLICALALTLCVMTALICLASCGSSDKKSALVGTWTANEAEGAAYIFNEDGTGKWDMGDFAMNFTYVDKGSTVEITYEGATDAQTWEYTVSDKALTMKDNDTGTTLTYTKK